MTPRHRWWVHTERRREATRSGFGEETLRTTLEHLRKRGDECATVDTQIGDDFLRVEVSLR